ncbi:Plastid movement impaired protein [Quillaja saponaria]|uniref:Plastid movement impaired protein n=1 Tax=Quillaja saponaria TaxID=32244 RepID=A0AAD7PLF3_QUISA|nr:Plastid movement impaired protein [Quillaja saponaria]
MGNTLGGGRRRKAKVMKVDGETFKLKTPARASDVVKDYPDHVLLDSEAVKHFGLRAKPLEPNQELKPKKIYFLVELPKTKIITEDEKQTLNRRVKSSGIHMNAKERLEVLMLSRRSISDLSIMRPSSSGAGSSGGPRTVKMRLPRSQLDKLMEGSHDEVDVAEKIISLYVGGNAAEVGGGRGGPVEGKSGILVHREAPWKPELVRSREGHQAKEIFTTPIGSILFMPDRIGSIQDPLIRLRSE